MSATRVDYTEDIYFFLSLSRVSKKKKLLGTEMYEERLSTPVDITTSAAV
jgi:hypothetical protein